MGWIVRSYISWREKQSNLYKGVEPKTVRLITIRKRSNRTIFASSELGLLQMVSELDTK